MTTDVDLDLLVRQRDQLFAEALVRYQRGEHWWPDSDFEIAQIRPEQDARFEGDAWEDPIAAHLATMSTTTVYDVGRKALSLTNDRIGTSDQERIRKILQHLGWRRGKRTGPKGTRWWTLT